MANFPGLSFKGAGAAGNIPTHSLDFESSSSQYLTLSSADWGGYDRSKYGISVWVKLESAARDAMILIKGGVGAADSEFFFAFDTNGSIEARSYVGGSINGRIVTTNTFNSTSDWYHLYYQFDSAASSSDRMRLWVNGTEITSFVVDTNPNSNTNTGTGVVRMGIYPALTNAFDGLMYQPCFFSGTLPTIGQLYDAGSPVDVTGLTGLWSLLNTNATNPLEDDYVLATNWTNVNTVVKSTTVP